MNPYLSHFLNETILILENLKKNDVRKTFTFDFSCEDLEDDSNCEIKQFPKFKGLFGGIEDMKGPVLYWYEVISSQSNDDILNALQEYGKKDGHRAIPAFNKKQDKPTKILYVGKCKRHFSTRVIQHLGYFKTDTTQGLQLRFWAKKLDLKLRLHAMEFDNNMAEIMLIVESYFAKKLNPLVGKHN